MDLIRIQRKQVNDVAIPKKIQRLEKETTNELSCLDSLLFKNLFQERISKLEVSLQTS
jgi:hypothetical protein